MKKTVPNRYTLKDNPGPMVAYCFMSGHVMFAPELPHDGGALPISWCKKGATIPQIQEWKKTIESLCRLSRTDGVTRFVPGIPECWDGDECDEDKALEALNTFAKWVAGVLTKRKLPHSTLYA